MIDLKYFLDFVEANKASFVIFKKNSLIKKFTSPLREI